MYTPDFQHMNGRNTKKCVLSRVENVLFQGVGKPLPKSEREKIFDKFYQVDGSRNKKNEGTGSGLTISKSIIYQNGGQLWIESENGEGNNFVFTIPKSG